VIATQCVGEDAVQVSISDTGKGIPPEIVNRIFDPFFTTKPVGKGTGLGLSLSWNIVKKHQGKIEVSSIPGKGTTFVITLPIEPAAQVKMEFDALLGIETRNGQCPDSSVVYNIFIGFRALQAVFFFGNDKHIASSPCYPFRPSGYALATGRIQVRMNPLVRHRHNTREKKMKKILLATLLLGSSTQLFAADSIKVAITGPFSGGSAPMGASMRDGAKLAINEINSAGGISVGARN